MLALFLLVAPLGCASFKHSRPEHFQDYASAEAPSPDWEVVEGLLITDIETGGRPVKTFRLRYKGGDGQIEAIARPHKLSDPEDQAMADASKHRRDGCDTTEVSTSRDRMRSSFSYRCAASGAVPGALRTSVMYLRPSGAARGLIEIEGEDWRLKSPEAMDDAMRAVADSVRLVPSRP
jgi:hypothetical protein